MTRSSTVSVEATSLADKISAWSPSQFSGPLVFIARERRLIEDALRSYALAQRPRRFVVRQENSDNLSGMTAWGECWSVIDAPDGPDAVTAQWVGFFTDRATAEAIAVLCADTSTIRHGACQVCGEMADLKCGSSRFGEETWACKGCWEPDSVSDTSPEGK